MGPMPLTNRQRNNQMKRLTRVTLGGLGIAVIVVAGLAVKGALADAIVTNEVNTQLTRSHRSGQLIVKYRAAVTSDQRQTHARKHNGTVRRRIEQLNADVVAVAPSDEAAALKDYKTNADVVYAEPNYTHSSHASLTPTDPNWAEQWGYPAAGFDEAWGTSTGAGAPLVADLDSGIDTTHPDLAANIAAGGYDFINNDADPTDDNGHGTSTAGVIAEIANNGVGGVGGCWGCKILPVKVLDAQGVGDVYGIAQGVTYAVDHGAKVLNASYGSADASATEAEAVAYANQHGAILVGAICEDQPGNPQVDYPSSYPGVIAVGALARTGQLEDWSCYGDWVQLAAPSTTYTTNKDHGYNQSFSGTSASAPFVTAAIALIWAQYPNASRQQVYNAILNGSAACCTTGHQIGGGQLSVPKALAALATTASPAPSASPSPSLSPSPSPTATPAASPPATATPRPTTPATPRVTATPAATAPPTNAATATPLAVADGDINRDGQTNLQDLSLLLLGWNGATSGNDVNQDGSLNVYDLSILLSHMAAGQP